MGFLIVGFLLSLLWLSAAVAALTWVTVAWITRAALAVLRDWLSCLHFFLNLLFVSTAATLLFNLLWLSLWLSTALAALASVASAWIASTAGGALTWITVPM